MKILVCIKQVAQTEESLTLDAEQCWIQEDESAEFRMNRFDDYALEEALLIKETIPGTTIDALSVGPKRVEDVLKRALSKGADNGIHIHQDHPGFCDPKRTAGQIAAYASQQSYDLILTGVMAEDDMLCQVGPMTAAKLSIPCAVSVVHKEIHIENRTVTAHCEMESGNMAEVIVPLPALLTIQSGINQPRYPSLSNMLRANSQKLIVIDEIIPETAADTTALFSLSYPARSSRTIMLEGSPEEKAAALLDLFHSKSLLKQG